MRSGATPAPPHEQGLLDPLPSSGSAPPQRVPRTCRLQWRPCLATRKRRRARASGSQSAGRRAVLLFSLFAVSGCFLGVGAARGGRRGCRPGLWGIVVVVRWSSCMSRARVAKRGIHRADGQLRFLFRASHTTRVWSNPAGAALWDLRLSTHLCAPQTSDSRPHGRGLPAVGPSAQAQDAARNQWEQAHRRH